MSNVEKIENSEPKIGKKRNFDIAFLSGENDKEEKERKRKEKDEETEAETDRSDCSAFSRYSKSDSIQVNERLVSRDEEAIIQQTTPQRTEEKSDSLFLQNHLKQIYPSLLVQNYGLTGSLDSTMGNMGQFNSLRKLLDASSMFPKSDLGQGSLPVAKFPIFPSLMGQNMLSPVLSQPVAPQPALISQPPPVAIAALAGGGSVLGPAASNTCAKCGITFRMTSDLVYHMRTHHTRGSENWRDVSSYEKRRQGDRLKCNVCGENFRERHHLTRHMTAHQDKTAEEEEERAKSSFDGIGNPTKSSNIESKPEDDRLNLGQGFNARNHKEILQRQFNQHFHSCWMEGGPSTSKLNF